MCGIAGSLSRSNQEKTIPLMLEAERHRGPDDWGIWSDDLCVLGHRRLAIIDLSEAGRQPLSNHEGTIWTTFNGEIYNFQPLRRQLETLGYRFRTRTDTEVLVYAYQQWGPDCVKKLRGMFAFAIWDQRRRRLFLARDRTGKKPLFYFHDRSRFVLASELQALLADVTIPREINYPAIDFYLSWGYVPAPQTAYCGVFKLPPAHWMTIDLTTDGFVTRLQQYWSLHYGPKSSISEDDAVEALREKLTEAVRIRMISDVPLGAFLSGGMDSSIVVGLMAKLSDRPVKTFSIGFREAAYNELGHAKRVAELWSTDHHQFVVEPDALEVLPLLVRHYGEPYADSSAVPTFYVSKMTRSDVTVALNGDGGDENFAGYDRYLANRIAERLGTLPGAGMSARLLSRLLPDSLDAKNRLRRTKRFLAVAAEPMPKRYARWVTYFTDEAKRQLYSRDLCVQLNGFRPHEWMDALFMDVQKLDPVDAAMAVDIRSYLPYDLLVKVDITSMANSLEARSPFLDHEVMEFAAQLPVRFKLSGNSSKYLPKRAFADLLPRENVSRPKMGFGVPIAEWFRGLLRPLLEDGLLSQRLLHRGYFQPDHVRCLLTDHLERRADHSFQLWNLLMLELWHREFLDKR